MVTVGDDAPEFTAPLVSNETSTVGLSEALADGPVVLAFFPFAFTGTCSHEMSTFQDRLAALTDHGATLYGVSIDTPPSLAEFRDQLGLEFGLLSDTNRELVRAYNVAIDHDALGIDDMANRAVFVIDETGTVTYVWVADNPGQEPDYDEVEAALD